MTEYREFHLGDILSITDGRLVSPRHIEGVYDILNFMTGDNLFTHALPRAAEVCRPELLKQHPQLSTVDLDGVDATNWRERLDALVTQFGETLLVSPLPAGAYEHRNPIIELIEMVGPERVVSIVVEE